MALKKIPNSSFALLLLKRLKVQVVSHLAVRGASNFYDDGDEQFGRVREGNRYRGRKTMSDHYHDDGDEQFGRVREGNRYRERKTMSDHYHDDGDEQFGRVREGNRYRERKTMSDHYHDDGDEQFGRVREGNRYRERKTMSDRYHDYDDGPFKFRDRDNEFQRQRVYNDGHYRPPRTRNVSRKDDFDINTPYFRGDDVPVQMDFYTEHLDVKNRSMEEVAKFLRTNDISCKGQNVPKPVFTFEEANFPAYISDILMAQKFREPTCIQSVTWPLALSGRDLIGIAQTGSGKTLAFMLPAIVHIMNQEDYRISDGPIGLIMTPTRELCQQVNEVSGQFAHAVRLRSVAVFGGSSKYNQLKAIRRGCPILVATPGRLNDLTSSGEVSLHRVTYLVLDEADRMLDMGFEPQIKRIVRQIRKNRQTMMWSATWPKEIQRLARQFLSDAVEIHVGTSDLVANPDIEQRVHFCTQGEKNRRLIEDLKEIYSVENCKEHMPKVLIFTGTKRSADFLARKMYGATVNIDHLRIESECLHGDKSQRERDQILLDFKTGRSFILIATDVASRGLDVNDITHVINYDMPTNIESYIHRIGRTGRAGKKGVSVSYLTPEDRGLVNDLAVVMENAGQKLDHRLIRGSRRGSENPVNFGFD